MCVILIGNRRHKPTRDQLAQCWGRNPHGAGAAWYDSAGRIAWRKGIRELEELRQLVQGFTGAWVVHARFITTGGDRDALTHPFPISTKAPSSTNGAGNASVLFHNGTWKDWRKGSRDLALSHAEADIPMGPLSDSRVIAWVCAFKGYRFLRLLPGRFAVVTRNNGVLHFPENGQGWTDVGGILYSNMDWSRLTPRDGSKGATWGGERWYEKPSYDTSELANGEQQTLPGLEGSPRPTLGGAAQRGAPVQRQRQTKNGGHVSTVRPGATTKPQPSKPRKLGQSR